jgi:hypothetical protein
LQKLDNQLSLGSKPKRSTTASRGINGTLTNVSFSRLAAGPRTDFEEPPGLVLAIQDGEEFSQIKLPQHFLHPEIIRGRLLAGNNLLV